jgi:hypothetical protein
MPSTRARRLLTRSPFSSPSCAQAQFFFGVFYRFQLFSILFLFVLEFLIYSLFNNFSIGVFIFGLSRTHGKGSAPARKQCWLTMHALPA